jgi:hypothetical protein
MNEVYFGKGIQVGSGFDLAAHQPLDSRTVVETKDDLYSMPVMRLVEGLQVFVKDEQTTYVLKSYSEDNDIVTTRVWEPITTGAVVTVVNNLESDDTTAALSAAQGKALSDSIKAISSSIVTVYKFKGSVDTYDDLPEDAETGDVYNVVEAHDNVPAGTNYAKTDDGWDALGGSIDTDDIYRKIDDASNKATDVQEYILTKVEPRIDAVEADLKSIVRITDEEHNQYKSYADTISEIQETLATKQDALEAGDGIKISDGVVTVKLADDTDSHLTLDENGLKLSGIEASTIKLGKDITSTGDVVVVSKDAYITDALQSLEDSITTAVAGGIVTISSSGGSITVSGDGTSRNIEVNSSEVAKQLVSEDSAIQVVDGKLELVWEEE